MPWQLSPAPRARANNRHRAQTRDVISNANAPERWPAQGSASVNRHRPGGADEISRSSGSVFSPTALVPGSRSGVQLEHKLFQLPQLVFGHRRRRGALPHRFAPSNEHPLGPVSRALKLQTPCAVIACAVSTPASRLTPFTRLEVIQHRTTKMKRSLRVSERIARREKREEREKSGDEFSGKFSRGAAWRGASDALDFDSRRIRPRPESPL